MKCSATIYILLGLTVCSGLIVAPRFAVPKTFTLNVSEVTDCTNGCELDFDIGTPIASVTGAWIYASGLCTEGTQECEDHGFYWTLPCYPAVFVNLNYTSVFEIFGTWKELTQCSEQPFQIEAPVEHGLEVAGDGSFWPHSMTPDDWEFLLYGTAHMYVRPDYRWYYGSRCDGCGPGDSDITFEHVTLVIEYKAAVGANKSTWGSLKARYR